MFEIINDLLPSVSVVLSALISYCVSRSKAKSEIKKIKLEFLREDKKLKNDSFANLVRDIKSYCDFKSPTNKENAVCSTATYLSYASPNTVSEVKALLNALSNGNTNEIEKHCTLIIELHSKTA